jgi:hypothetical protein
MKKRSKKDGDVGKIKSPKPADGDVCKIIACVVSDLSIEKDADVTKESDLVVGRASEKDAGVKSSGLVYEKRSGDRRKHKANDKQAAGSVEEAAGSREKAVGSSDVEKAMGSADVEKDAGSREKAVGSSDVEKAMGSVDVEKAAGSVEKVTAKKVKKAKLVVTDVFVKNLTLNIKGPSKDR